MKSTLLGTASAAAVAFGLMATGAQAQSTTAAPTTEVSEVTVTGSRVITNGNNAPTPVTVISLEQMAATKPTTVFENLSELPMFSGSRGATNTPTNAQPGASTSVSALNLRNLGGLRGLALFDGHRVPPTTADGYTNINILPSMLLQRVDVVTGGASAVYGSDAVTGVINFITDRNFNGIKAEAQTGISQQSDAKSYDIGIAAGTNLFDGRAHIEASYEGRRDDGIPHKNARDWTASRPTLQGNGTAANPFHLEKGVNIAFATFGGLIVCPGTGFTTAACPTRPLVGQTFDENGVLSPFETGSRTGLADTTIQIGGDGAYHTWPSLKSKVKLDQAFARFDLDITDNLHFFVSGTASRDFTLGHPTNLRFFGQGVNIGACNAFLAAQYRTALGCTPANTGTTTEPTFVFNKIFNYLLNPNAPGAIMDTLSRNEFVIGGFEGKIGDWRWETAYTHSEGRLRTRINKNQNLQRTYAALDAVVNPANGQIVCRTDLTNPGVYPGCVPLNVFGPSAESKAALDYIFQRVQHNTTHKLDSVSGSISGSPISLWAGDVDIALSGEIRKQTYGLTADSTGANVQNCVGLRFGNCNPGVTNVNVNVFAPRTPVEQKATEGAFEISLPLIKDKPYFQDLNFNGAIRYTHYANDANDPTLASRTIDAITWKTGVTWAVVDRLTLRWARSRDIRAPNLFDLYSPVAINPSSFTTDYLLPGNPNLNVPIQSGGNPFLKPEVAHTTTLGMVFRPTPSFSFAMDAYSIKIRDALANINGSNQAVQLACYNSGGTSPLCDLQERPLGFSNTTAANRLTKVYNRQVNIAYQKTKGIDMEANYRTQLFDRAFSFRGLVTFQPQLIYYQPPLNINDQAGVGYNNAYGLAPSPVWKATAFVHYDLTDKLSIDISERYRSGLKWNADPTQFGVGGVKSVAYTNLNTSYKFENSAGQFVVYLNIQNLFDKDPPPAGAPGSQNQPGLPPNGYIVGDDVVGRYYTLGLRFRR